jgi:hypothetical protein
MPQHRVLHPTAPAAGAGHMTDSQTAARHAALLLLEHAQRRGRAGACVGRAVQQAELAVGGGLAVQCARERHARLLERCAHRKVGVQTPGMVCTTPTSRSRLRTCRLASRRRLSMASSQKACGCAGRRRARARSAAPRRRRRRRRGRGNASSSETQLGRRWHSGRCA